jgi:hypothetical protein
MLIGIVAGLVVLGFAALLYTDLKAKRAGRAVRSAGELRRAVLDGKRDARAAEHTIADTSWTAARRNAAKKDND